jgi:hypothetical protein
MCMVFYLSASKAPELVPWIEAAPEFYVAPMTHEHELKVHDRFSKPFVVYVGASTGCGCGFGALWGDSTSEAMTAPKSDPDTDRDREALLHYLRKTTGHTGDGVELFMCWDGDQSDEPRHIVDASISKLGSNWSLMRERTLMRIRAE